MRMHGKAHLTLIASILDMNYHTLYKCSLSDDFPEPVGELANVSLYDVSRVARYLGIQLP